MPLCTNPKTDLRDQYAGQAMQALLVAFPNRSRAEIAEEAFEVAYAMLKQREEYYDE